MSSSSIVNESGLYGAMCLAVSRMEALLTAPIGKKGLGTAYRLTNQYLLPGKTFCRSEIASGTWMRVPTFEPYWAPVAIGGRPYEPEIRRVLTALKSYLSGRDWAFLDCGANFGYWSAIVSGPEMDCPRVAAVEANPSTYKILLETLELNRFRFRALHRALSDSTGQPILIQDFGPGAHAQARATSEPGGGTPVTSISIDGILTELRWEGIESLVIKLDVEGMEIKALAGARSMRRAIPDHVFLYEDHGSDLTCETTQAFLDHGYAVLHVDRDGTPTPITSLQAVRDVKVNPVRGYNFVAVTRGCGLENTLG